MTLREEGKKRISVRGCTRRNVRLEERQPCERKGEREREHQLMVFAVGWER